ncbi:MAG: 4Fe-4S dicluster domain-containing protein [Bacteroidetes bacterium]|nr:4Fe-4S dicluster domain-containing protein [Bacteroidota bacterium]
MAANHHDTTNAIYDVYNPTYWDPASLSHELNRIYDICNGCRLCFNICPSFPALFNSIDQHTDLKRARAVQSGLVSEKIEKETYDDSRPEGEHAVEASIEATFSGTVYDLTDEEKWKVVDLCYQCKLCDPVCPYTPAKGHDFQLDFPKLMTRAQAIRTRKRGVRPNDKFLSNTDFSGKMGTMMAPLTNFANNTKLIRSAMHKIIGIHKDRMLPDFQSETLEKWYKKHKATVKTSASSGEKVVIFATCFTNNNDPSVGKAAIRILEHNEVEVQYPVQQCCGAPYLSPGDFEGFKKQSLPNILELSRWVEKGYKIVVTGPPTCSLTIKTEYLHYFSKNEPDVYRKIQMVAAATMDISEYLVSLHKQGKLKTDFKHEIGTVNYHLSCHLKAQNMGYKSRDLLRVVPNTKVNLIDKCSGMDGGWGMKAEFFDDSMAVAAKLVNSLKSKECNTTCSDCTLAGLQVYQASKQEIKPVHPVVTLYNAYGFDEKEG